MEYTQYSCGLPHQFGRQKEEAFMQLGRTMDKVSGIPCVSLTVAPSAVPYARYNTPNILLPKQNADIPLFGTLGLSVYQTCRDVQYANDPQLLTFW
ncbi:hypothetical protein M378DRAFT_162314 [Amanita muscaria Koide BX008]|nr:hypothetical protein M378DRAFT_162314 [Amanita muscaria Koide BX008]